MSPSPPPPPGFMRSRASSVVDFSADGARQRSASMSVKGSEEGDEHRDLRERENGGERDLSVAPLPEGDESELVRLLQRDSMTLNEDGAELKQTLKLQAPVACVAFSQGGSLLAGGSRDGVVRIWNMDDTSVQHVLRGHRDRVWSLSFSPGQGAGVTNAFSPFPFLPPLSPNPLKPRAFHLSHTFHGNVLQVVPSWLRRRGTRRSVYGIPAPASCSTF